MECVQSCRVDIFCQRKSLKRVSPYRVGSAGSDWMEFVRGHH